MTDCVIQVESLGKKYLIRHLRKGDQPFGYVALRDVLAEKARHLFLTRHMEDGTGNATEDFWALKDVSFEVKQGERIGIIGRNGAGKSTLLKVLSRITEPSKGRVRLKGRVASLLEVGTGFHPELTGRENIFLNGAILGMPRGDIRKKFDEIVAFAEVEKFLDTPVKRYSSGMYVRLAFAVAAHLEPEILIVDEVLAVGDAQFQKKCLGKMQDVAEREGRTILFVTHNMPALYRLCNRAILFARGKLIQQGEVNKVVHDYLQFENNKAGEISWLSALEAPGNDRIRLRAIRILSAKQMTSTPDISEEITIQVEYWNLVPEGRRTVGIQIHDCFGSLLFSSSNLPSASRIEDTWYSREFPVGCFQTNCTIPANLLNDGDHRVSVFIVGQSLQDVIIQHKDALTFTALDSGHMSKEFTGKWLGAIRPKLAWRTEQVE